MRIESSRGALARHCPTSNQTMKQTMKLICRTGLLQDEVFSNVKKKRPDKDAVSTRRGRDKFFALHLHSTPQSIPAVQHIFYGFGFCNLINRLKILARYRKR